jgi:hypothetical protein
VKERARHFVQPGELLRQPGELLRQPGTQLRQPGASLRQPGASLRQPGLYNHQLISLSNYKSLLLRWIP